MGDTQTTKAAETTRVKQKSEDRPPHEREYAPSAFAEATLFRAAASDDPTTPPQHMARVLRRLASPHQTGFLLQCQRHYGNAYVQRMVSSRDDGHSSLLEQEAYTQEEPIARQVTALQSGRAPDGVAKAQAEQAASLGGPENIAAQTEPLAVLITPNVQRQKGKDDEEDKPLQSKSAGLLADSFEAGADLETQVNQSKGRGSPLPDSVRAYMEPRFGVDFSHVHVHTGSDALQMNQAVGAQAFTHGSDIYFGAGHSPTNLELTAHELTHVVQQTGGAPLQTKKQEQPLVPGPEPSVQRSCVACAEGSTPCPTCAANQEEMVQRQAHQEEGEKKLIQAKLSVSQPNDPSELNARAFTTGQDIFLRHGEYNPSSSAAQDGEQLQRARTQAKERAATGGAPSEREKGHVNFLSTQAEGSAAADAQQSSVQRIPARQSEEPRVAPPETSLTDQRPQSQSSAPIDVQTKRRSGEQGNSTDGLAPGTEGGLNEKEGGAEKSGSTLIAKRITPVDSPSIQSQRQLEPLGAIGVAYGAAVIIGKNSVYELKGSGKFEPNIFLRAYLYHQNGQALINVQFGSLAKGKMYVEDRGPDGYRAGPTSLPMTHPEISPPGRGRSPSLIVQIGPNSEITGSLGVTKPLPPNSIGSAPGSPEDQERFLTLLIGQSGSKGKLENIKVQNELKGGHLDFVYTFNNTFHRGTYLIGSVVIIDEAFAFAGTLHTSGKGLVPAETEIQRDKTGNLIGRLEVSTAWEAKRFKGKLALTYEDGVLEIRGSLKYDSPPRVTGEVNVVATEEGRAWQAIQSQLPAVQEGPKPIGGKPASGGQTAAPAVGGGGAPGAAGAADNIEDSLAITGWGVLKLKVTDKIDADAAFVVDPDGYLTTRGTIRSPHKIPLMDAKPTEEKTFFDKDYSDMEYVAPAVGIRAKVHIKFTGKAEFGPLTLHDITITGLYSTRPNVGKELQISARLNLSGSATAKLAVGGELALRLGTKYKYLGANPVDLSLNTAGEAQVRGVVEAEPTIKVNKGSSKDDVPKYTIGGELFIGGEADIKLTGDLVFSAAGKDFWEIHLDEKVFPIAGFGLTTKVAYTIGSDELPDVTIKKGNFEPYRFIRQAIRGKRAKDTDAQVKGGFKESGKEKGHVVPSDVIPDAPPQQPKTQVIQFTMHGSEHSLYLTLGGPGDPVLLEMATRRRPVKIKILNAKNDLRDARADPKTDELTKKKIDRRITDLEQAQGDASRVEQAASKLGAEPDDAQLDVPGLKELGGELQDYGERYDVTDLEEPAGGGPAPVPSATPPGSPPATASDPCSEDNMRKLIGSRSVAKVISDSTPGDKIDGKRVKPNQDLVEKNLVAKYASQECHGSPFPAIDLYPGKDYTVIDEGHHRFVASRLRNKQISISGTHRATDYDPVKGNFADPFEWKEVKWQ
jgi:hypothetical protein